MEKSRHSPSAERTPQTVDLDQADDRVVRVVRRQSDLRAIVIALPPTDERRCFVGHLQILSPMRLGRPQRAHT